jgi:hypothetical protein
MIGMSRVFAILVSLLLILGRSSSQEFPEITPETPVDTATLHTWLVSLDPHLIAWAADFARRRHDAQIVSEIPPLLEQWSVPVLVGSSAELNSHRQVVLALLDALIQENATVPVDVVDSVADQFPAQALILIKRLPPEATRATLMNWAFGSGDRIEGARGRAAAMLLAQDPDAAFVSRIVAKAEQHVTVHVVSEGGYGSGGMSMGCGDNGRRVPAPGYPQTFAYRLREFDPPPESAEFLIAQIGSHTITAERVDANEAGGECSSERGEGAFRHELIAYWLGMDPADMPWMAEDSRAIVWSTQEGYERELGTVMEQQRLKMLDSYQRLRERGLLEALPEPRVVVAVQCGIDPCPLKQPNEVQPVYDAPQPSKAEEAAGESPE